MVAAYATKLACELPETAGRSLSHWFCSEIASTLEAFGIVDSISAETIRRILESSKLKPWRVHHWLSAKVPRDEAFRAQTVEICDLYTRQLGAHERVLCADEKTSIQPRPRTAATKPARAGNKPVRVEHEYTRAGAVNLLAAFDTRTGEVIGICRRRKRQVEFMELLEEIERQTPPNVSTIWIIADNVSVHHGKEVRAWLEKHPRFQMRFTPVHCSWMNQVEQWFSIVQKKRLAHANFVDLETLEDRIRAFISEWNDQAQPFAWTAKSFEKVLAKCPTTRSPELHLAA